MTVTLLCSLCIANTCATICDIDISISYSSSHFEKAEWLQKNDYLPTCICLKRRSKNESKHAAVPTDSNRPVDPNKSNHRMKSHISVHSQTKYFLKNKVAAILRHRKLLRILGKTQ